MSDVVIGCLLSAGQDVWRSGHKVRGGIAAQVRDVRPFVATCNEWKLNGVLIHDGLSTALCHRLRSPHLTLEPYGRLRALANLDRRYFATRDYVDAHPEIARLWMIDANDVLFTRHPFEWFRPEDATRVCVGVEWSLHSHPSFTDHLKHLPPWYGELLQGGYGNRPALNAGQWGSAGREVIEGVLNGTCENISEMIAYLKASPAPHEVCRDSPAFGAAIFRDYPDRHITFVLDGERIEDGRPSPVLHDRKLVMARLIATGDAER